MAAAASAHTRFYGGTPHLIAHRGGSGLAPENTLAAFVDAVRRWGADMVELDVRATSDGHCVVMHDPTVDRTTDGRGDIAAMTLGQVRLLDAGYRFTGDGGETYPFRGRGVRVPTIDEVLDALPDTRIIVEVKHRDAQRPLFEAIRRHGASHRVLAAGAHDRDRTLFAAYDGPVSASGDAMTRMYVWHRLHLTRFWKPGQATSVQMPIEHWGHRIPSRRLVRELKRRGLTVHVWTVDDPDVMRQLLDWGVDGILSDRPDVLARVLNQTHGRPLPRGVGPAAQ